MRLGKRTLAGAAAGALALGMISIASAPAASAGKSIKPKLTSTAAAGPVRDGAAGSIPYGLLVVDNTMGAPNRLTMVTSPGGATMWVSSTVGATPASTDDSAALGRVGNFAGGAKVGQFNATLDDSTYGIAVSTAGTYTAQLSNGSDTITFSFTTTKAPKSLVLAPATQTVLVGQTADLAIEVKDADGNRTQPAVVDEVMFSDNTDDTVVGTASGTTRLASLTGSQLAAGISEVFLRTFGNPAGTTTVTATPEGTLPSLGVTATTAAVTKSGSISTNTVAGMSVTAPANAINDPNGTDVAPSATAQLPSPTSTVTVTIDDTTAASAGNQIRLAAYTTTANSTVNGKETDDTAYVLVTTDANKKATATFTLGGAATINGGNLTVKQVNVLGAPTSTGGLATLTATVLTPAVYAANVVPTPAGTITAVVGSTSTVTVQVDDSFGNPAVGYLVSANRTSPSVNTAISTGTTDATGKATVTVTNLRTTTAGSSETYSFTATNPVVGSSSNVTGTKTLTINYATTADVTSLSVAPVTGAAGSFSNTTAQTKYPVILTPSVSNPLISATGSNGVWTVSSASVTTAPTSNMIAFNVTPSPVNSVTVTVPDGLKVSSTVPNGTTTSWASGSSSATITGGGSTPVYVWGTKTGVHDVTFSSTGMTVKGKILIVNRASDAYNIAMTPDTTRVAKGAISTVELSVTDMFGNAVATGTGDDSGSVKVTASGDVLLAGFNTQQTFTTNAAGKATVTIIAGNAAGTGLLTATPASLSTPAWVTGFTPQTGMAAPKTSAVTSVVISDAATKSITITGSRTTVSGKPGIQIDGVVTGIEDGKTVIPYFRFPGETTFTQGSARPEITDGSFTWQRKTGKKFYAYVTNDDGSTTSNRVIIPAN
jgi:hypothetical protein